MRFKISSTAQNLHLKKFNTLGASFNHWARRLAVHLRRFLPLDCSSLFQFSLLVNFILFYLDDLTAGCAIQLLRFFKFSFILNFVNPFCLKINQKCQLNTTVRTSASWHEKFSHFKFYLIFLCNKKGRNPFT